MQIFPIIKDTLASVVARGANANATINVGASNTLTLASGSITDSTGAIDFGNENLQTTGRYRATTNAAVGAMGYPALIEVASSDTYKISSAYKAGINSECYFDAANYSSGVIAAGLYFNRASGTPAGASNSYIGLYGGAALNVASGTLKYWGAGLWFEVFNSANLDGGTLKLNTDYIHYGINVSCQMGFAGSTISNKANCQNHGLNLVATMAGTFNSTSTTTSTNFGGKFSTVDSITDGTGNIISYGCYISACAGRTFGSGGVLTSWGLYEVNGRNNAFLGPISIGKLTAPTVPLDVVGAILNTTTIEAGTGFRCGGTPAVADGTYTTGIGGTTNGTITTKGGIITAIQQAVA